MKIAIINASDSNGGAAIAALRLHNGLIKRGIQSKMFVLEKKLNEKSIVATKRYNFFIKLQKKLDLFALYKYRKTQSSLFSVNWVPFSPLIQLINDFNPDIIHLHWIGSGTIRLEDLLKFNRPIIWSMHDMYTFTGGCHYDDGCGFYENGCHNCKVLGSNQYNDLSYKNYHRKLKLYLKLDITVIGLSKWLRDSAAKSTLLKGTPIINLPNCIDVNVFSRIDKNIAREKFHLPIKKKLLLFGAVKSTSDLRKGFNELSKALDLLDKTDEIELVVIGNRNTDALINFGFIVHYLGIIENEKDLVALYSACDVLVVPSLQENLSNMIMEGLSCGTPVVGFNIGGNSDLILHKVNGYLAKPFESEDLSTGIRWILDNENYELISNAAREKVLLDFDEKVVIPKYLTLYDKIILKKPIN